jgi:UDP-N-acetylmuramoyl-tripeptide--D-alanyl-D-alanine ligase
VSFWSRARLAQALDGDVPATLVCSGVSTDTRTLAPGDLFVALAGERFDGHGFLEAARDAGAAAAVVRRGTPLVAGLTLVAVDDTLHALGRLARVRRAAVPGPVVAITGTNGKTATKELAARALGVRWQVHATPGNLNNEVGVPLTILSAPADAEALVVEAGASVPGELARLREVIAPTAAIVTNVSAGHLQGFGGVDGVLAEKVSLLVGVALAVVGTEPAELAARARDAARRVVSAGLSPRAAVRPDTWTLDAAGRPQLVFRGVTIRLPLAGRHQVANAMLALALAEQLDVDLARVGAALERVTLPAGRWEMRTVGDRTVIHDAYNANPASMLAALETVAAMRGDRPLVVVVGSMLELGAAAAAEHARVAEAIVRLGPALVGAVGEFVPALERHRARFGNRLVTGADADALGRALAPRLPVRALVLLKGSRGMRLERALPHLLPDSEAPCSTTC